MNFPQVTFQVRLKSHDTLEELGKRVGQVLGCDFQPSTNSMFDSDEALEASCLGLQITLSHDPEIPEGELRTYVLMGSRRGDIEAQGDIDVSSISISEYILGVMKICDSEEWYIASRAEQLAEAGIEVSN